jgi:6-phosphogluconolactonase (cycloisomerase 2 family)
MKERYGWSRREFVRLAGSSLGATSFGAPLLARVSGVSERVTRFVYVGFGGEGAKEQGIAIYDLRGGQWKLIGVVASVAPSALTLDGREHFLYAVNEVDEYEGLPSGSVEAYSIDAADGGLKLVSRQKLSLSATAPRHAAVSPDGKALVVAVHGGGAYNVLPIGEDGRVGSVSGILKETGSGPCDAQRSAHPQMIVFDRAGKVIGADLGSDRLSVLKFDAMRLKTAGRYSTQTGEGPRQLAFHPDGRLLFVANELEPSVACYEYDVEEGRIVGKLGQVATAGGRNTGGVIMALDPAGEFLYTAHRRGNAGVSIWRIVRSTGGLRRLQIVDGPRLHELTITADGRSLLGLSREESGVFGWHVANGQIGVGVKLIDLAAPLSIAAKSL